LRMLNQIRSLSRSVENTKSDVKSREILWEWLQNQQQLDPVDSYSDLLKLNLTIDEVAIMTKALNPQEFKSDRLNYVIWAAGRYPKDRDIAFKELSSWDSPEKTKQLKKFLKAREKFDAWEEKEFRKLISQNKDEGDPVALRRLARQKRESYERLKYACSAKVSNNDNANAGKNFRRFIMTVGPV